MNFNSFIRYLAFLRWSRLFAFVCAFIGCTIVGYYFTVEQVHHRQLIWEFKNVSHFYTGSMELEPGRVYEVTWESISEKSVVPTELIVNDEYYDTMNYFGLPYKANLRFYTYAYIDRFLQSPMRLRVNKATSFGMIFRVHTNTNFNDSPWNFFSNWFSSWFDPISSINWKVRDITDFYKSDPLVFDGEIEITKNR